ncbi:MAG: pantoate--beta-alanine ligase [Gammaproteobacteria bacterium]|nr:pantoate--beta-alanine ligase [Gammaproteobacteria bacterium]
MQTIHTIPNLRAAIRALRAKGKRIAFVPTMGNLHAGHLALVERAQRSADAVVVSIFVNPLQFGAGEDFESYPRTEERDAALLVEAGVRVLFLPTVEDLYPHGQTDCTRVMVPELSDILCGASRPGHFVGVTTIVTKLFNIVMPDVAVFGEKDYQQLVILRRMVRDLNMPIELISQPTEREADGLAMSSRNGYLSAEERAIAPGLYRTLCAAREALRAGQAPAIVEAEAIERLHALGFVPEYVSVRRADDLSHALVGEVGPLRILAAARLGRTRLIDNVEV